jgi:hypothetical protein
VVYKAFLISKNTAAIEIVEIKGYVVCKPHWLSLTKCPTYNILARTTQRTSFLCFWLQSIA